MKVLFIQPSQNIVVGKQKKNSSIMPPLGIMSIAAMIRIECPNVKVEIYDYEASGDIRSPDYTQYDIIGISATSVHIPHAYKLIQVIRKQNENVCIIIGGPHATFAYRSLLNEIPELDAVIIGEGELSISYLINHYTCRNNLPKYPGIVTRDIEKATLSPILDNLDKLPNLSYDLIDINNYQLSTHRKALKPPFISYITSRGCPFSCNYCQTPNMFGKKIRYRSPLLVYNELESLKQSYNYKSIVFWDDTFTSNRNYTVELCSYLEKLNIRWMCNTRVDRIDKDLLQIMKQSGCEIIFFGVESFYEPTLKFLNRTTNETVVNEAFSFCKDVGISTVAALMIGTPGDNLDSIEHNINKLIQLHPDNVYISIYNVTVGSEDYKRAVMAGIINENIDWKKPNNFYGPPFGLPTVNTNLNRFQLQTAQKSAYAKFYGKGNEKQYE